MECSYIVDLDDDEETPLIGFNTIYVFWVTTGLEMTYGILEPQLEIISQRLIDDGTKKQVLFFFEFV